MKWFVFTRCFLLDPFSGPGYRQISPSDVTLLWDWDAAEPFVSVP